MTRRSSVMSATSVGYQVSLAAGLDWNRIVRTAGPAEIAAASGIRLNLEDDPTLVPLETLPGRDHYLFPPGEGPPWRWSIASRPSARPFG
jgi:hypothetical protein